MSTVDSRFNADYEVQDTDAIPLALVSTSQKQLYSAPGFGQVIAHSSARKKIFNFAANGSNERSGLVDVMTYMQDESAAGRAVQFLAGLGDYGVASQGIKTDIQAGSSNISFLGSGRGTRFGWTGAGIIAGDFGLFEFAPDVTYLVTPTSVSVAGDNVTVTIGMPVGHNTIVDSYVRVERVGDVNAEGIQKVTAITTTSITYVTKVAVVVVLGANPRVHVFNSYLSGFEFGNLTMYDDNPSVHISGDGTEESHGGFFKGMLSPNFHPIYSDRIGDETLELTLCEGYRIPYVECIRSPSVQSAGGGFVSIKQGCHNGEIGFIYSRNPYKELGDLTYVLSIKTSAAFSDISGLKVGKIVAEYPEYSAVNFSTAGANISDVDIYNLKVIGGTRAISQGGASFNLTNINFHDMNCSGQTQRVVDLSRNKTNTNGIKFYNPVMDGSMLTSSTRELMRLSGTNNLIVNPTFKNATVAVLAPNTKGLIIEKGVMDSCGESIGTAGIPIRDEGDNDTVIDGLRVTNSLGNRAIFKGCEVIKNCPELESGVSNPLDGIAASGKTFTNNKKVSHRVRLTGSGGEISSNEFIGDSPGSNGMINVSGDDTLVTGNKAPNLVTGSGIIEDTGQDRNIIKNNNMNGAAITTVGVSTIVGDNL